MYPAAFAYHRASSVSEAIQLVAASGGKARFLAGGHSLLPMMKLRLASPEMLVDIGRLGELRGIRVSDGELVVGALTTHREVHTSPLVREQCPVLAEAAGVIGDPQVRNRGTVGGNLAHADPASDLPAVAMALQARIVALGPGGRSRTLPADAFFVGPLKSALEDTELVTEVRFSTGRALGASRTGMAYAKFAHPASGYAVVGVAAVVGLDEAGNCQVVRIGVTGVADRAFRAESAERALVGRRPDDWALEEAARLSTDGVQVQSDLFASSDYRAHLCRVFVKRALAQALQRARAA